METVEVKETALKILDERESGLIALADQFKDLKINGVEDKDGYKKVRQARIELKNARVEVQNDAKALRENAVKFQKTVIAREKELILITLQTEESLQREEDQYNQALEAIRVEKDRKEKERIQNRIASLAKFNYAVDLYEVTTMPDDKFNELLTQVEIDYNKEQERIAQEKAETERMRNEEAERLRLEREALAKQKAEQEARELELQRQEHERKAEATKQAEAIQKEYEEFRAKKKAEQDKLDAERNALIEEKRKHEEQIRLEQAKKESAERARLEEQDRIKREAEEKAECELLTKIEAERQEALKPDKEKLYEYAKTIMAIPVPELSHKDAKQIVGEISERVVQTSEFIHDKAIAL